MSEDFLSIGDRVVVLENDLHPEFEGQTGVIEELGAAFHFWVKMPDGIMYGFNEDELIAAPASGDGVADDSGYTELIDELSGRIKGLERERDAIRAKYLELVAMISYYTEDNKGLPYCRDIRGEVAKTAQLALDALKQANQQAAGAE
jgi:hypothetical protein